MPIQAGAKIRAGDLNRLGAIVGRAQRTTDTAGFTAATRILSVIANVVAGRTYRVILNGEVYGINGAVTSQNELRHTTTNVEPSTTSPILARALVRGDSTIGVPDTVNIVGYFYAATSGVLRVALVSQRVAGSVPISWAADPAFPMTLVVEDCGDTIPTTGTVYAV
jgi:hypothetical protein